MTKEQLLEEAKRRYPISTKFRCANGNNHDNTGLDGSVNGIYTVREYGYIHFTHPNFTHGVHSGNGWLYLDDKWAEVVSTPETKTVNSEFTYNIF